MVVVPDSVNTPVELLKLPVMPLPLAAVNARTSSPPDWKFPEIVTVAPVRLLLSTSLSVRLESITVAEEPSV